MAAAELPCSSERGRYVDKNRLRRLLFSSRASHGATASDKPAHRFSCTLVRLYVAKYSLPAAETWARSHGATDVEIV